MIAAPGLFVFVIPDLLMRRILFTVLLGCLVANSNAQSVVLMTVPLAAISQLEDMKESTKLAVRRGKTNSRTPAELRPDLNRYLVISADDFLRVAASGPTKAAYLKCLEAGLVRVAPFTIGSKDREQVAAYYQELMEIVGLESSEGRLAAFVARAGKAE